MHIGKIYEDAESWASSNHVTPRTSFPAASRRILAFGEDVQDGKYKFLTTISDSDYEVRFDFSILWDGIPYQMHAYLLQGKVRKV